MKIQDFVEGLKRLGLNAQVVDTKDANWKRVLVHHLDPNDPLAKDPANQYVGVFLARASFHYGELTNIKLHCHDYWACAIQLMADKKIILNHINFYALHVKAHNAIIDVPQKGRKQAKRWLEFRKYFREKYYGKDKVQTSAHC